MEKSAPVIIAIDCQDCAYLGADLAGAMRRALCSRGNDMRKVIANPV